MSDEHFSVDGTLIKVVASIKSFRRRTAKCCDYVTLRPLVRMSSLIADMEGEARLPNPGLAY